VVSVDAAYHFADAWILARLAKRYLSPGGKLAYTTLLKADVGKGLKTSAAARMFMKAASIPEAAVPTSAALTTGLADMGFTKVSVELMTKEVCLGFANFVGSVAGSLTLRQKLTPACWKIALTAKACQSLEAWGLSYALVTCEF
jgi:ABC-type molybdate transport system substrate-binding protein